MTELNRDMRKFLAENGIKAMPKYLKEGSLKGCWRLYDKEAEWTDEIRQRLTALGFKDFDGRPLNQYSGNGGHFSIFARL